ncbi:uncharacterized protein LOC120848121, partial [Ixodes scapularis]|uniref:uncharacterized protein LOC120848121 n=1 Tax=Ixodes scapularis TaxID=6945 RepID=UPI001C38072B
RHCFAPGCQTGCQWRKGEQPSLFSVPKVEEQRKLGERNLHRKDKLLDETCSVCELHFEPSFITRDFVHVVNGEEVRIPRGKPQFLPGAVPTLLPNAPSYLSKKASQPRPPRKRKNADASSVDGKKKKQNTASPTACSSTGSTTPVAADTGEFDEACMPEIYSKLCVPSEYWSCHRVPSLSGFVYCKLKMCDNEVLSESVVIFSQDSRPGVVYTVHLCGRMAEGGRVVSCEEAEVLLRDVDSYRLCGGAVPTSDVPRS